MIWLALSRVVLSSVGTGFVPLAGDWQYASAPLMELLLLGQLEKPFLFGGIKGYRSQS
jgi:hypothetical protein